MASNLRVMTDLEVRLFTERNHLIKAARVVLECWDRCPVDGGGLPVALEELRDAVAEVGAR